jgi:hypothetical protein
MDPWSYSLRELLAMQEAKLEEQWWHTAAIMCTIHNSQVTKRREAKSPAEFHPTERRKRRRCVSAKDGVAILTQALLADSRSNK